MGPTAPRQSRSMPQLALRMILILMPLQTLSDAVGRCRTAARRARAGRSSCRPSCSPRRPRTSRWPAARSCSAAQGWRSSSRNCRPLLAVGGAVFGVALRRFKRTIRRMAQCEWCALRLKAHAARGASSRAHDLADRTHRPRSRSDGPNALQSWNTRHVGERWLGEAPRRCGAALPFRPGPPAAAAAAAAPRRRARPAAMAARGGYSGTPGTSSRTA